MSEPQRETSEQSEEPGEEGDREQGRRKAARRWGSLALRLVVPALLVGWLLAYGDVEAFAQALTRISLLALPPAAVLGVVITAIGGARWRIVMHAFGGRSLPPWSTAIRVFFVGHFYNTFIPGAVSGDLVRGVVSRRHFDDRLSSYAVVVTERLLGISALGAVFAVGLAVGPRLVAFSQLWPFLAAAALLGAAVAGVAIASGRLRKVRRKIPTVHHPQSLVRAFGISVVGHGLTVALVWTLATGMGLPVGIGELLFAVPLAILASILPLAVAGVGPREAALVALLGLLGVEAEEGLALSLSFAGTLAFLALVGGVLQLLLGRVGEEEPADEGNDGRDDDDHVL